MKEYALIRRKRLGEILYFSSNDLELKRNDYVIVESPDGGEDYGTVVSITETLPDDFKEKKVKRVIRKVVQEDISRIENNYKLDEEAFQICWEKVKEKGLKMKLIDSEYSLDRSIVTFYYWSEERIDFREIIKELAEIFKCRIEMHQVGLREEAKIMGGYGICGQPLCCTRFLKKFSPITIRMAKAQNLPLDDYKISGLCGRLMCCLRFEEEDYQK